MPAVTDLQKISSYKYIRFYDKEYCVRWSGISITSQIRNFAITLNICTNFGVECLLQK